MSELELLRAMARHHHAFLANRNDPAARRVLVLECMARDARCSEWWREYGSKPRLVGPDTLREAGAA